MPRNRGKDRSNDLQLLKPLTRIFVLIKVNALLKNIPIVYVGGSAGGLDAYIRLLKKLPADMGVAIVMGSLLPLLCLAMTATAPRRYAALGK